MKLIFAFRKNYVLRNLYDLFIHRIIKQMIHSRDKYFTYIHKSFIKFFLLSFIVEARFIFDITRTIMITLLLNFIKFYILVFVPCFAFVLQYIYIN